MASKKAVKVAVCEVCQFELPATHKHPHTCAGACKKCGGAGTHECDSCEGTACAHDAATACGGGCGTCTECESGDQTCDDCGGAGAVDDENEADSWDDGWGFC